MWGSSGLALSSAWGTSWCLCGVSCCGSSEMSHAIPPHVFQTLKSHRWNCNVFGRCRKFGYPNCMRVLVDEAPKVNSCVRSSSHDTVHDPRHASTTTPTPHNAKSWISGRRVLWKTCFHHEEAGAPVPGSRALSRPPAHARAHRRVSARLTAHPRTRAPAHPRTREIRRGPHLRRIPVSAGLDARVPQGRVRPCGARQ